MHLKRNNPSVIFLFYYLPSPSATKYIQSIHTAKLRLVRLKAGYCKLTIILHFGSQFRYRFFWLSIPSYYCFGIS